MSADRIARGALVTSALAMRQASRCGLVRNGLFGEYPNPTGLPTGWGDNGSATTPTRVAGDAGPYAMNHVGNAAGVASLFQDLGSTTVQTLVPSMKLNLVAELRLVSGALTGAGLYLDVRSSANGLIENWSLTPATDVDVTGASPGAGVVGATYRFIKSITLSATAGIYWARLQLNTHATINGSIAGANSITWLKVGVEPRIL